MPELFVPPQGREDGCRNVAIGGTAVDWDHAKPWYHGSPVRLTHLRPGSTITQDPELARVFSHKPSLVVQDIDDHGRRTIKHSGRLPGYLYEIAEPVGPGDVYPHPETTMEPGQEWLTTRELRVRLVETTDVRPNELLTPEEIETLMRRLEQQRGDGSGPG